MGQAIGDARQYILNEQAVMLSKMKVLDPLINPNTDNPLLECPEEFDAQFTGTKLKARLAAAMKVVQEEG